MSIAEKLTTIAENEQRVFESGKQVASREFWDSFMVMNTLVDASEVHYYFAGHGWNQNNFYPPKDFIIGQAAFAYHNYRGTPYNLAERLEECGVKFTLISSLIQTFCCSGFTRIPELDVSNLNNFSMDRTFAYCYNLVTIDKIIFGTPAKINETNSSFRSCDKLKNITFEGEIPSSMYFSYSPLSYESAMSVINALKNYSGTATTETLTLSTTTKAYLSDSDIAIATQKGWTVA